MDYTQLVAAVDFGNTITAVVGVFVALTVLRVAIVGARKFMGAVR